MKKSQQKRPNRPDRLDRLDDARALRTMQTRAKWITRRKPLREWAAYTSRTFGWWSHVIAAHWDQIRPTMRDAREVEQTYLHMKAEEKKRNEAMAQLWESRKALAELEKTFDELARKVAKI